MSFLDTIITAISPKWGLRRAQQQAAIQALNNRGYDAAGKNRRTAGWNSSNASTSQLAVSHNPTIRQRTRDLVRNNPWGAKIPQAARTNVVGGGIKPSFNGPSKTHVATSKQLWRDWAETTACDFYGRKNIYGIQRQIVNALFIDGEVFVRFVRSVRDVRGVATKIPMQLQTLSIDFLDTSKNSMDARTGNYTRNGIEFDTYGRPVAYWIYRHYPNDLWVRDNTLSDRVPTEDLLHIFHEENPGQYRGVSKMAASLSKIKDFEDFTDAELMRQKIAACFVGFVHTDGEIRPGERGDYYDMERFEPGTIEYLRPGQNITLATPPETKDFDIFSRTILQGAATGTGLTYEVLTGDLSNVNFSSGRMGWIEMSRAIQEIQQEIIVTQFGERVIEWFYRAAAVAGLVPERHRVTVSWTVPRREMLDPVKETKGLNDKVRAGFVSFQDAVRELGDDPDVVMAKHKEDRQAFDAIDAKFTVDPRYDPSRKEEVGDDVQEIEEPKPRENRRPVARN